MPDSEDRRESGQVTSKSNRRTFGKAVLAGVLGGPAALSSIAEAVEGQPRSARGREADAPACLSGA